MYMYIDIVLFFFLQGEGPLHGDQMPKFIEAQR